MAASVLTVFHPSVPARWSGLGAGLLMATVLIVRSRAGIICALAAVGLMCVLRKIPTRRLVTVKSLAIGLVGLAILVLLAVAFWGTVEPLLEPFYGAWRRNAVDSDAERWQSTVLGFQAWLKHPVFGNGLGAFLLEREAAGLPALVIHSVPVWFLAEMGIVGLAAYVFFVASLLYCGISALRRRPADGRGILIVVASFVLMGLVHDIFFQRTFWFACSLVLLNLERIPGRTRHEGASQPPHP
jgi:O-antigen ligase